MTTAPLTIKPCRECGKPMECTPKRSAGGSERKCIKGKEENMNRKDELKRRIELKRQLIKLTEIEIEALNAELQNKTRDRLITENRQPEPASLV